MILNKIKQLFCKHDTKDMLRSKQVAVHNKDLSIKYYLRKEIYICTKCGKMHSRFIKDGRII